MSEETIASAAKCHEIAADETITRAAKHHLIGFMRSCPVRPILKRSCAISISSYSPCIKMQLSDETIASVSRAIMGRLDIVDLIGRNTADEFAERVGRVCLV